MYLPSITELIRGLESDDYVKFMPYSLEDELLSKFSPEAWELIKSDIKNEEDWSDYLINLSSVLSCLMISSVASGRQIAFILLSIVNSTPLVISFHGGGWASNMGEVRLYYRAMDLIFKYLKRKDVKIQTSCLRINQRAYHFILSLGCVLESIDEDRYYFILP